MAQLRWLLILLLALSAPARAADVVFPPGSRIGIAPPPGMTPSRSFFGFEDREHQAIIFLVPLPAKAYDEIERSTRTEVLQQKGMTVETREDLSLPAGKGVLVIARQQIDNTNLRKWFVVAEMPDLTAVATAQFPDDATSVYPDAAVRASLTSLAARATVPVDEQLGLLPFKVGELAEFRVGGIVSGRALMLTDAAPNAPAPSAEAHMVVSVAPGGPPPGTDRAAFARDAFRTIPDLKDVHLISSEPLRIGGSPGYQIMAQGKDESTDTDITIVQWLRFGGGAFMQLVGVAPTEGWIKAYARFRQVRDGIEAR